MLILAEKDWLLCFDVIYLSGMKTAVFLPFRRVIKQNQNEGVCDMKVKTYGLKREFYDRYNPAELLKELGMTPEQIISDIKNLI